MLFDSAKMYLFLFCVLLLITVEKFRQLTRGTVHSAATSFDIRSFLLVIATVFMAIYLPVLLRKISNKIEQLGIILTEVLCVLWIAKLLADLGFGWANIQHGPAITAVFQCAVAALAGVRMLQVWGHPSAD